MPNGRIYAHDITGQADVRVRDRVRTKSGRTGVVRKMVPPGEAAVVTWDDGDEFAIRCCHLEVLARDYVMPNPSEGRNQ